MIPADFLDDAIAERDAAIECRLREEIAAALEKVADVYNGTLTGVAYHDAARIARGGAA